MTRAHQRIDHRVGDDHHVAGRSGEQRFLHRADRAEAGGDGRSTRFAEPVLQRLHEALRCAGTQHMQCPGPSVCDRVHWSAFAPEILTMRAHLVMSSFR